MTVGSLQINRADEERIIGGKVISFMKFVTMKQFGAYFTAAKKRGDVDLNFDQEQRVVRQ